MCRFFKKKKIVLSESLLQIKKDLKRRKNNPLQNMMLTAEESKVIDKVEKRTHELNRNNVTRTRAYLDFYNRHPDIHWALLGHMVSRNGGWNMTDLKGQLSKLVSVKEAHAFFTFLERGNWLIFQDAYPQFLIYEESLKAQKNLFYLLHYFHVSVFMEVVWEHFWRNQDSYILAIAQVINEQAYLEERVLQNPVFKKEVFHSLEFKLQEFLEMTHILFPFQQAGEIMLVGQTLNHFESLHERILLGKRLYDILFNDCTRLDLIKKWAQATPHTGSRKDYWPRIFNDIDERFPSRLIKTRIKSCELTPESSRIYSPRLEDVWKDVHHKAALMKDWYEDWRMIHYLTKPSEKVDGEIKNEYCKTLEKIELATIAKKAISTLN